jgi:hypothetical protein
MRGTSSVPDWARAFQVSKSRHGRLGHQELIDRILVIHVPDAEGFDTYFSLTGFLLHDFVNLIAFDICETMFMGEGRLRNVDFPDRRFLNLPITSDTWQDVKAS